jgi:hypothetical protein
MLDRGSVRHRGPTLCGNDLSEVRLQSLSGATVMELHDPTPEPLPDQVEQPTGQEAPVEDQELKRAVGFLAAHFQPAPDAPGCSVMLTTDQLFDRISSHSPGEVTKNSLVRALRNAGYIERYIGQEFKWLMNLATAA